jgi:lauroyl/myristoyl acyltransferase
MASVLSHRGRVLVFNLAPLFEASDEFTARVEIEGQQNGDALEGRGFIILGFHMGLAPQWPMLARGYDFVMATSSGYPAALGRNVKDGWRPMNTLPYVRVTADDERGRAIALYKLRAALLSGRRVAIAADAMAGHELFRIPVPDGELVIRSGWWFLRAAASVPVLPVLARRHGSGAVLTMYPPLPPPPVSISPESDLERCRAALVAIVQDFVRQYPGQCLPWRFERRCPGSATP